MGAIWVSLGGAAGALARYGVYRTVPVRGFPWSTAAINVLGSFLLGVLLQGARQGNWSNVATLALGTGFLGAFTTFSTFSWETLDLLRSDRPAAAATYAVVSMGVGVGAAAAGYALARATG